MGNDMKAAPREGGAEVPENQDLISGATGKA
jgi:hypothetical protein